MMLSSPETIARQELELGLKVVPATSGNSVRRSSFSIDVVQAYNQEHNSTETIQLPTVSPATVAGQRHLLPKPSKIPEQLPPLRKVFIKLPVKVC